jgi:dihydroneopterin aldolase
VSGTDRIELRGIRVMGLHGLLEEEQVRVQPFEIDLDVEMDLEPAGTSDSIARTVNYAALADAACAVVEGPHVDLVERLAELIAEAILYGSPIDGSPIDAVVVSVRKLRPPVPMQMSSAGVTIRRERQGRGERQGRAERQGRGDRQGRAERQGSTSIEARP